MTRLWRAALLALALMLGVAACSSGDDEPAAEETAAAAPERTGAEEPSGEIRISNWDAYMPEDLIANFEKETGVKVKLSKHTTNEDIMGKIEASNGGGFDLVFVSGPFAESLTKRGWATKLNKDNIPNASNLVPEAQELPYDPGNQYSMPYTWGTTGLCYRSDKVKSEPTSWNDLLKPAPELRKKITMLATDRWLMLPALKTLGYSVNTKDEAQLNEAKAILQETKKDLLAYDDTTFYSKLVSGEAHLVEAWDGWCNYGIGENDKIKFVVPEEGSDLWTDSMVVLESSENKAAAEAFINYVLRPEVGQAVSELVLYKVPNGKAMERLPDTLKEQYPNLGIEPAELLRQEGMRDVAEAAPLWSRTVTEITKG